MSTVRIKSLFVVLGLSLCAPYASAQTTIIYDPSTGNLMVENPTRGITTFEGVSADGTGYFSQCENITVTLVPPFDQCGPDKLFKLSAPPGDYNFADYGNILTPGLDLEQWLSISWSGSLVPDGSGNNSLNADGLTLIPPFPAEPGSSSMLVFGLVGALKLRRTRRCSGHPA